MFSREFQLLLELNLIWINFINFDCVTHFTFVEFHWPSQDFQLDIAIDSGRGNEVWEKKEVRGGGIQTTTFHKWKLLVKICSIRNITINALLYCKFIIFSFILLINQTASCSLEEGGLQLLSAVPYQSITSCDWYEVVGLTSLVLVNLIIWS